ncbi:MAG: hypothetical protein J0L56_02510 [Chitinophagales bacterium]|nr:hypothetical protein [Chitinophagales bacterium]
MTKSMRFIGLWIFLFPLIINGQKQYEFTIDSSRILDNKNLDDFSRSLKTGNFYVYKTKDSIPAFIMTQLGKLANGFSIANPNESYQCCCSSTDSLPQRQLSFLAKSNDVLVLTYKTGGVGVSLHLLMIRFDKSGIVDLWSGYCWNDVKSIKDIVYFIEESKRKPLPGRKRPSIQVGVVIL